MKKALKLGQFTARVGLLAFAIAAIPAMAHTPGWYFGFGAGPSRATIDEDRIVAGLTAGRLNTTSFSEDDRDSGYKIFFGRQLNHWLALEAGAFDLGKYSFSATTFPVGTLDGNVKFRGLNLDLVGSLPVTEKLSAFARVGVNHARSEVRFSSSGQVLLFGASRSERDTNWKAGVGLEYAFNPALSLRGEFERYRVHDAVGNKGDIDHATIGLVYRFGARPAPMQRTTYVEPAPRVIAPEPVSPAPAPRPPVAVAPPPPPPPPPPTRVTFSADALFDFDKSTLKPAGKQALDKFASDLRGVTFDVVTIAGHTDRIGTVAYNQKLSAERAESVRAYLVQSGGIPADRIRARGEGKGTPVTQPGECKGDRTTGKLVACLQPDRRVEVEVSGTRR